MTQVFHPVFNTLSRATIFGALAFVAALLWFLMEANRSDYQTGLGVARTQPVPFSHQHHVTGIGLDCRFCHWPVEDGPFAGIPATEVCMACHSQIWSDSPALEPVRASLRSGVPIRWTRVHDLPDFVHFDHGIHVRKGVACETCHGRVDRMPAVMKAGSLQMEWCLDCHRNPEPRTGPVAAVFRMGPADDLASGARAPLHTSGLTDCSLCHQ
jgi:Cytochrome c7 and related cytochrome c